MTPFGLFATQLPLLFLGAVYLLYLGLSFTGKEAGAAETAQLTASSSHHIIFTGPARESAGLHFINFNAGAYDDNISEQGSPDVMMTPFTAWCPEVPCSGKVCTDRKQCALLNILKGSVFSRPPPALA